MSSLLYNGLPADDGEEQKFWCTVEGCDKCYKQKRNLMIHIKLDHSEPGEIPWHACQFEGCDKAFKYKCALNRHVVLYHSGMEARESMLAKRRKNQEVRSFLPNEEKKWKMMIGGVENDPDSKMFQCCHEGCNRSFTSKGSLNLHIERKHERPFAFVCPVETCARQFSYKHVLQTHVERVHHIPFNHEDYPNPKRQRTPRVKAAPAEASADGDNSVDADGVANSNAMMVAASESSDSDNDEELEQVLMENTHAATGRDENKGAAERGTRSRSGATPHAGVAAAAQAALSVGPGKGRKRGARSSALGNLAEIAHSQLTATEGLGKGLLGDGGLTVHLYECDHPGCSKVFSWKGSLALHKERIHKQPDSYPCPVADCAKNFSYKHVLQQHLRRVHKLDPATVTTGAAGSVGTVGSGEGDEQGLGGEAGVAGLSGDSSPASVVDGEAEAVVGGDGSGAGMDGEQ